LQGLSHQEAHKITFALARLGVIEVVRKGKAGLNSGKAAEFRYLLPQTENTAAQSENGRHKLQPIRNIAAELEVRASKKANSW
jgi:hypothetical protein